MLTIGFISKIDKDTIFVTRNHIERDTPFPRENGVTFHIGDIVAINTFDSIVEGFRVSHIESIKLLNNIPINEIKIELEYSCQQLLINIATNNFCNEFFYDKLRDDKISKILLTDFLQDIICDNIQPVANYVQSTDIKNIAKNRRISIDEILDKMVIIRGIKSIVPIIMTIILMAYYIFMDIILHGA